MKIKIAMRCHLTLVRMAIIKNLQIVNAGEGVMENPMDREKNLAATVPGITRVGHELATKPPPPP